MLPLGDEIRPRLTPYVNWMMIASCIVVFLWQVSSGYEHFAYTLWMFGIVPARVLSGDGLYTFVTNIFLHGGWMHLLGNMLFLYIFGDNIEGACGHLRYLAFYITCGVAASALWVVTALGAHIPAVGASGAISGVMGDYFVLFPGARIRTLVRVGFFWRVMRIPAYTMIGLWFVYQFLLALLPFSTGVAYWAHIGGFVAGIIFAKLFGSEGGDADARYLYR
ncbi:MAG: rhomboid family intramembrane serine protease [Candidatus Bathyarchaeia archaeon]